MNHLQQLLSTKGWTLNTTKYIQVYPSTKEKEFISKIFKFKDFKDAFSFLTRVAEYSELKGHHPEIYNCYSTVELLYTTHDAGNKVTEKDKEACVNCDLEYDKYK
jgi:4a-hydroxytetrahydrobiopterin dehydratase